MTRCAEHRSRTTHPHPPGIMSKKPTETRVLSPSEYPESITAPAFPGAHKTPPIFAIQHPLGIYHVEDDGAGIHGVYFTARRAKKPKRVASAANMAGAFRRISHHEDELLHPRAEREEGKHGPVSIYALGQRTKEAKPNSPSTSHSPMRKPGTTQVFIPRRGIAHSGEPAILADVPLQVQQYAAPWQLAGIIACTK